MLPYSLNPPHNASFESFYQPITPAKERAFRGSFSRDGRTPLYSSPVASSLKEEEIESQFLPYYESGSNSDDLSQFDEWKRYYDWGQMYSIRNSDDESRLKMTYIQTLPKDGGIEWERCKQDIESRQGIIGDQSCLLDECINSNPWMLGPRRAALRKQYDKFIRPNSTTAVYPFYPEFMRQQQEKQDDKPIIDFELQAAMTNSGGYNHGGACLLRSGHCIDNVSRWACYNHSDYNQFLSYGKCSSSKK